MRKIFLTAGHKGGFSGANANGFSEACETINLRNQIANFLKEKGVDVFVDYDTAPLSEVIQAVNSVCSKDDICIDIHFNAVNNPYANGSEVLRPFAFTPLEISLAEHILHTICLHLNTKNRGVKHEGEGHHSRLAMLSDVHCNTVIVEVCFISNENDVALYLNNKESLASALADTIFNFAIS